MNIAIVDDEPLIGQLIKQYIQEWADTLSEALQIDIYESSEAFLFIWGEEKTYDIVFLDIEMKGLNGVALAQKIRKEDVLMRIVFITASADYIFEGFEMGVLNYLLKPVDRLKLHSCLNKAYQSCKTPEEDEGIVIKCEGFTRRLKQKDIFYIEACKHSIRIQTDETISLNIPFKNMKSKLPETRFIQCHRSYLVNIEKIVQLNKQYLTLESNAQIPVSRSQFKEVHQAFVLYHKEKMKEVYND